MKNLIKIFRSALNKESWKNAESADLAAAISKWSEKAANVQTYIDFNPEQIIQVQAMMNFWLFCNNAGYDKIFDVVYSLDVADRIKDIVWNVYEGEVRKNNSPYFFNTLNSLDASLRGKIMVAIMEQYNGISIEQVQENYLG